MRPIRGGSSVAGNGPAASAQSDNKVSVPLSDPTRPVSLRAHLVTGSITVKGADVKEVWSKPRAVVMRSHGREGRAGGMKRIPMTSTGLNIEAENNKVRISTDSYSAYHRSSDYGANSHITFTAYRE